MCGIVGLVDFKNSNTAGVMTEVISRMTETLRHRGPDDGGVWVDDQWGVALGHRRLSIVDLSADGHQPMSSTSGRYVIAFNGEVYNFLAVRRELESAGQRFRGHSDTEVLLQSIERWGLDKTLSRVAGMFAFALWDRSEQRLDLVRDRLGKKPLYFGWSDGSLLFASELKAFRAHPRFNAELDRGALALLLRHGFIPAPHTIFKDVFKLPPGTRLSIRRDGNYIGNGSDILAHVEPYWSAIAVAERGVSDPFSFGSESEALNRLDELLSYAVSERMIADVPIGALLSGGIDSSTVVALMQRHSSKPVKTFTVGFHERGFDEAEDARRVAEHLGTEHIELFVTPEEAQSIIPRLPEIYDEPFADSSQIPTFLIAQLARRHVTVVLSGDGGDEVFGGYWRHFHANTLACLFRVPALLRAPSAHILHSLSPYDWNNILDAVRPVTPRRFKRALSGDRIHKFAGILRAESLEGAYRTMLSQWLEPKQIVRGLDQEPSTVMTNLGRHLSLKNSAEVMMALDTISYLPDDVLTKVDRATMAVSLEARAPLLDYRLVEFAWRLPIEMKVRNGAGKWILRQLLRRYVPQGLFDRPKQGFSLPIGEWLRGSMRGWAEDLLSEHRLRGEGILEAGPIRRAWGEHLAEKRNHAHALWGVLMFQAWREKWLN
jgi:asparagine synthase (glutamine-hydrolysing)